MKSAPSGLVPEDLDRTMAVVVVVMGSRRRIGHNCMLAGKRPPRGNHGLEYHQLHSVLLGEDGVRTSTFDEEEA